MATSITLTTNSASTEYTLATGGRGPVGPSPTGAAIATALGIPTHADLTAANAALAIGQPYYDTALVKLQITTA